MTYKPQYTKEEVTELVNWFNTHKCEQDIDLGSGIHITNLDMTVTQLSYIAQEHYDSPVFSGQVCMLFRIRDEIIKQHKIIEG